MESDVIIIGGGVLGVSLAYNLAKHKRHVLLVEREPFIASHASGKNAGMFRQLYRHPQLTDWASRSLSLIPSEIKETYFEQTGSIITGRTLPDHHTDLFIQTEQELQLRGEKKTLPCLFTPGDGLLDSGGYVNSLFRKTDKNFLVLRLNTEVKSIGFNNNSWDVECSSGEVLSAPWVVNAAGAWVNQFLKGNTSASQVEVEPFARYLYLTGGWPKAYMPVEGAGFFWDELREWYMRKWTSDLRLVSICDRIPANPDTYSPQCSMSETLAERLLESLPDAAKNLSLNRFWHCFRTYTRDQLPIWGEDSNWPGLFWLGAFGGFGMSTSFAATFDAAKYITGQRVEVSRDLSPNRVQQYNNRSLNKAASL